MESKVANEPQGLNALEDVDIGHTVGRIRAGMKRVVYSFNDLVANAVV